MSVFGHVAQIIISSKIAATLDEATLKKLRQFKVKVPMHMDSEIIANADEMKLLKEWMGYGNCKLTLLFRGSRDGFTASKFHSTCDN